MTVPSSVTKLHGLLRPERISSIVHVGASAVETPPNYIPMVKFELAKVIGFEPQVDFWPKQQSQQSDWERYLPYTIWNGEPAVLRRCRHPGLTGLFAPDERIVNALSEFAKWVAVESEEHVVTRRLDDVAEVEAIDYLCIDAQGSELGIIEGASEKLKHTAVVQAEMPLTLIYRNQPTYADIDNALRDRGFIPHTICGSARQGILPFENSILNVGAKVNQTLSIDVAYVKDFSRLELLDDEQIKHLAMIVFTCFQSFDLAYRCVDHLHKRGSLRRMQQAAE